MANVITDNRTLVDSANSAGTVWVDIGGSALATDTEIKLEGTASIGGYCTTTVDGTFYRYAADTDLSNNHVYIWVNCGVVGLLETKANQGLTFRARGPTVTNYLEWDIAGSDAWPVAIAGGWVQFVIDLESTPTRTNGTAPLTTAIRELGVTYQTATVMPRMTDNIWVDEIRVLADGTPGITVEGRNGGSTDWNWSDLPTELGITAGTAKFGPAGTILLNTPVEFFTDDASTHAFTSTNEIVLWEDQEFAAADLYGITVLGANTGTSNFSMGLKSGTGNDATGAQGGVIAASATGVRWYFDSDIANIDSCNMYGVQMIHGADFQIDDAANSWISCTWLDCTGATVNNAEVLACSVVDANTADGTAFMLTDDMGDIVKCSFEFSDGHAIELTAATPTSQNNIGNLFSGYTNTEDSTDAAILNSNTGNITISASGGSNLETNSFRNTSTGDITILNNINVTFTGMKDNSEVRIYDAGDGAEIAGIEDATSGSTDDRSFAWSDAAANVVNYVIHNFQPGDEVYQTIRVEGFTVPNADTSIGIQQQIDRNAEN